LLLTKRERYDLITSITVLQHHVEVEELIAAFVALRSALKHGGRIIVLELAPPTTTMWSNTTVGCCIWWSGHLNTGTRPSKPPAYR
jgi:2-polyprenyl-3-methyl-5-hydroxy-6-metoxy-1,4-benzoquinol methylase